MEHLSDSLHQYGRFAFVLTLWIGVVVGMFDATRRLATFGYSRRLVLYVCGYALFAIAVGSFYFWAHRMEVQLLAKMEHRHTALPEDWAKDQPLAKRHEGSKAYATVAFRGEGLLLKHLDANGNWVQFQPTADDVAQRDAAVAITTRLAEQSLQFWRLTLEWWLGSLIAAAIGFGVGRSGKVAAANNRAESDARKTSARGSP